MSSMLAFMLLLAASASSAPVSDVEIWNEGVEAYRSGDVTNALRVLKPLLLSKTHGARAAEVVAKIEYERGNRDEAANAAQLALRANPTDAKAVRNFTRATDGLLVAREAKRIDAVLKASEGKDPGALLKAATDDARRLFVEAGTYRTNAAPRAVALADAFGKRAERLADAWIPVRQVIAQSVTNEEQAATILTQIEQAQAATRKAATELADLEPTGYATMSQVEHDFTRFLKLTVLPPAALDEDLVAQSNAWQDVEAFNTRSWQPEALDYTRAFRAKFPMWARAYEQQAQTDTNRPPFTAEAQSKVSALATELEKLQLECCEKNLPASQEKAVSIILEIKDLLPKDRNGGGQSGQRGQNDDRSPDSQSQDQQPQDQQGQADGDGEEPRPEGTQEENPEEAPEEKAGEPQDGGASDDPELEALLKKAQERNDEHEADKKARMRKAPLPPNERDW